MDPCSLLNLCRLVRRTFPLPPSVVLTALVMAVCLGRIDRVVIVDRGLRSPKMGNAYQRGILLR